MGKKHGELPRKAFVKFCKRFACFTKKVPVAIHPNSEHIEGAGISVALLTSERELHYEAMWIFISV